jgi:undecaprenyl-diphosphatase
LGGEIVLPFDQHLLAAAQHFAVGHPGWVRFMSVWCVIFAPNAWRFAAFVLAVWLASRRAWQLVAWVAVTMTFGGVLGALLKLLVRRPRPDLPDPVAHVSGYSFPSGHALNSALGATVLLLVLLPVVRARALLWAAAIVLPLVTGLFRVGLGVHWPSDVLAGWLLGVAVPLATFRIWRALRGSLALPSRAGTTTPTRTPRQSARRPRDRRTPPDSR